MSFRRMLVLALLAGTPGLAGAQFTTFIPPQNKVADSVKAAVAVQQKVQADSIAHTQITNMRTWVDSAAGLVPTTTAADSLAQTTTVAETATMRNGTRAPATASDLPLLALAGIAALVLGAFLVGSDGSRRGA